MNKHNVRTPEQALAYLVDCTLATVMDMASIKSRKKSEFERQIAIAQQGVDWMVMMGVSAEHTRAANVANHRGSVKAWIEPYIVTKDRPAAGARPA